MEQLCYRDAPCADGAEGTFAFAMSHGVEKSERGMFAIGGTRLEASRTASRLRARPLTKLSEHS